MNKTLVLFFVLIGFVSAAIPTVLLTLRRSPALGAAVVFVVLAAFAVGYLVRECGVLNEDYE